jgi:hypothetical protein
MHDGITVLAALVLFALAGAGCASAGNPASRDPRPGPPPGIDPAWLHSHESVVEVGKPAPDFTLATPDGRTSLSLSTFQGRPLVLVFGSRT